LSSLATATQWLKIAEWDLQYAFMTIGWKQMSNEVILQISYIAAQTDGELLF